MSLGVNLLIYLTEIAAKSLNNNFLSKVYEVHHKYKKDMPSGTAIALGKAVAKGLNKNFDNISNLHRDPFNSVRKKGEIGFSSTRGGDSKFLQSLNN